MIGDSRYLPEWCDEEELDASTLSPATSLDSIDSGLESDCGNPPPSFLETMEEDLTPEDSFKIELESFRAGAEVEVIAPYPAAGPAASSGSADEL